jgi:hypothetical protein
MRSVLTCAAAIAAVAGFASAQQSPPATATGTIGGKTLTIKYAAPSVRGREIFGPNGRLAKDPTFPIWRAGANAATSLHTDADLDVAGLAVPKGDYTLFVNVKDPDNWELIVNKQTGQWGLTYKPDQDLGRVKMTMSAPPSLVETLKWTITDQGGGKGKIELAWEKHAGTVAVTAK